jgi:hypothetical protein
VLRSRRRARRHRQKSERPKTKLGALGRTVRPAPFGERGCPLPPARGSLDHFVEHLGFALIGLYQADIRWAYGKRLFGPRTLPSFVAAVRHYEKLVKSVERVYGSGHPVVLDLLYEYGGLYQQYGLDGRATALYSEVLGWLDTQGRSDLPYTRTVRATLARVYLYSRHPERAVPLYEQLAATPDLPYRDLLDVLENLGRSQIAAGDDNAAAATFERIMTSRDDHDGPDTAETLSFLKRVAEEFEDAGRPALAAPWYERLAAARQRSG